MARSYFFAPTNFSLNLSIISYEEPVRYSHVLSVPSDLFKHWQESALANGKLTQ